MLTILKKSDVIDERYLKECDMKEVDAVLKSTAEQRLENRIFGRGYSKNRNMRTLGDIPATIYWHPKFRHIFHNPDPKEGQRLRREFLKKFSKFMTVDKM